MYDGVLAVSVCVSDSLDQILIVRFEPLEVQPENRKTSHWSLRAASAGIYKDLGQYQAL